MDPLPPENNQLSAQTESLPDNSNGNSAPNQLATGPRTELGKQRASHNATKYGIFSKVIVLKGESSIEYEELLVGLVDALEPHGALEELLVEKLATTQWRLRRLFVAEGAEIRKNTEFFEWDQKNLEDQASRKVLNIISNVGFIEKINYPDVLTTCLLKLKILRKQFEKNGFNLEFDMGIQEEIYGHRFSGDMNYNLYGNYEMFESVSRMSQEDSASKGFVSPHSCRQMLLEKIDDEILRLKDYEKEQDSLEAARTEVEVLRHSVPDAPALDRLLRYEASLERSFDRTLSQLERLQRIRRGQPVLPEAKVRITTDA